MKFTARTKGILLMVLSACSFSLMSIAVKLTGSTIPVFEQVFFRNIVIVAVAGCYLLCHKIPLFGPREHQLAMFGRSLFGITGVVVSFMATNAGNQADVSIMSRLSPFLITVFSVLFLKEKMTKVQIPALLLAFGGAFLVANPKFNSDMYPILLALACSLISSFAYTLVGYLKGKADPMSIVMHLGAVSVVLMIPAMLLTTGFVVPTWQELALLLLIGVFGAGGQIALTYAYKLADAGEVSIYSNTNIIFSALLGWLVLGETIALNTLLGGLLVLTAMVLVYVFGRKEKEAAARKAEAAKNAQQAVHAD